MTIRFLQALLAIVVASLLAGCNAKATTIGGKQNPDQVGSVVSLSPSTTEVFAVAGVGTIIKGKTAECDYPSNLNAPVVVKGTKPDYEAIAALNPDLVVYDKDLYTNEEISKFESLNIKTYAYGPKTIEQYAISLIQVSQLINQESRASKTLDKLFAAIEEFQGTIPKDGLSAMVALGGGSGDYMVAGSGSYQYDLFSNCHLEMQAPEADRFVPVNIEQIIQWNPDMIIATESTANAIFQDPRLSSLNAVKNKAVLGLSDDLLLRVGVRQDIVVGAITTQAERIYKTKAGNN